MKSIYSHPYFRKKWPVLVMAHRGGGGLAPENTMVAFRNAVEMGVDVLETDIHSTADGVLVTIHNDEVDELTDGSGPVHSYTLAELQRLDAGYWWTNDGGETYPFRGQGITIPTLEEVFTAFPETRINIDIKQKEPPIVDAFARLIVAHDKVDEVLVGSFHDGELARFRRRLLEVVTASGRVEVILFYLLHKLRLSQLSPLPAQAFQIPEEQSGLRITPHFIDAAHRRDTEVHIWTVNEVAAMKRLIAWGVDGIITDYPDRLLMLLQRRSDSPPATRNTT